MGLEDAFSGEMCGLGETADLGLAPQARLRGGPEAAAARFSLHILQTLLCISP